MKQRLEMFSPMSQLEEVKGHAGSTPTSTRPRSRVTGSRKRPLTLHKAEGRSDSDSDGSPETRQEVEESEHQKKRRRLLREKMRKLLAYDKPAALTPLATRGSPASGREFKSPRPHNT